MCRKGRAGFLLIEILIALAILAISLPVMLETYIFLTKKILLTQQQFMETTEHFFLDSFLRKELAGARKIMVVQAQTLTFLNQQNETIEYALVGNRLRRRQNGAISYLNQFLLIQDFRPQLSGARLLALDIKTKREIWSLRVYLPAVNL